MIILKMLATRIDYLKIFTIALSERNISLSNGCWLIPSKKTFAFAFLFTPSKSTLNHLICVDICSYEYAGVKEKQECWCGNAFTVVTSDPGACLPCTGDYTGRPCGSNTYTSVYNVTHAQVDPRRYHLFVRLNSQGPFTRSKSENFLWNMSLILWYFKVFVVTGFKGRTKRTRIYHV